MTGAEVTRALAYAAACWPTFRPTVVHERAWTRLLAEFTAAEVSDAIDAIAAEGEKFAPAVGRVAAKVRSMATPEPRRTHRAALEAMAARGDHRARLALERMNSDSESEAAA